MSFTTWSGPLRSGTKRDGSTSTGQNLGLAVLAQALDTGDLTNTVVGTVDYTVCNLPQGALIIDMIVDMTVAAGGTGTTTFQFGSTVGGSDLMAAVATTAGGRFRGTTTAATQLAWQTSTTADTTVYARLTVATATLTAGRAYFTIVYMQRLPDGTMNKTRVTV